MTPIEMKQMYWSGYLKSYSFVDSLYILNNRFTTFKIMNKSVHKLIWKSTKVFIDNMSVSVLRIIIDSGIEATKKQKQTIVEVLNS